LSVEKLADKMAGWMVVLKEIHMVVKKDVRKVSKKAGWMELNLAAWKGYLKESSTVEMKVW
jgi:hypothetical protein